MLTTVLVTTPSMTRRSRWDEAPYPHELWDTSGQIQASTRRLTEFDPKAVLWDLRKTPIISHTWQRERTIALEWFDPTQLVSLYNAISQESVRKNRVVDPAWSEAIIKVLSDSWLSYKKNILSLVWRPHLDIYVQWPTWDMNPTIPGEAVYTLEIA